METSYTLIKNSDNRIVSISEYLFSQSGDWYLVLSHYFDRDGKTFAFEKQFNFFNSGCTAGVAYETTTWYYNPSFATVNKQFNC